MLIAYLFISMALISMVGILISNVLTFPRLRPRPHLPHAPLVSVLIPARNEATIIQETLTRVLAQTYPNFEVWVLDDHSTDETLALAKAYASQDTRLHIIEGSPLPTNWLGKAWACHQLAQYAQGEILVFTDADTLWQPEALNAVITAIQAESIDLYTVWSTQITITWSERLIVPLMGFVILSYLPSLLTHYTPFSAFAAANGQFMAWRKPAYQRVGGHQGVAQNVLDDVTLARQAKKHRLRLRMADGAGLIRCRMYQDWLGVRDGFAKNILAGYGKSVIALMLATVFHWVVFLLPFYGLSQEGWREWSIALIMLGVGLRALSAVTSHQRIQDALLMPVSVLLMTRIAAQSLYWHFSGGTRWKGRVIDPISIKDTP